MKIYIFVYLIAFSMGLYGMADHGPAPMYLPHGLDKCPAPSEILVMQMNVIGYFINRIRRTEFDESDQEVDRLSRIFPRKTKEVLMTALKARDIPEFQRLFSELERCYRDETGIKFSLCDCK